jgi:hypothetical protein
MKIFLLVISLLFSMQALAHCPMEFEEQSVCAELTWIDGPHYGATSHFLLKFWSKGDPNHEPVEPTGEVDIYSWMIMHHGHDHAGPALTVAKISDGIYEVMDARFFGSNHHGFWEIRVDILNADSVISSAKKKVQFNIPEVEGGHEGH